MLLTTLVPNWNSVAIFYSEIKQESNKESYERNKLCQH